MTTTPSEEKVAEDAPISNLLPDDGSCSVEGFDLYKLDYEIEPIAARGEVLKAGLHVYMECTGYQHHAIVLDTHQWATPLADEKPTILIAEFTNAALLGDVTNNDFFQSTSTASGAVTVGVEGGFRIVKEPNPSQWHVVKYQANPLETMTWRPGTCSGASPSPVETILSRVQFLHDCRYLIPDYHLLASNCETVAVWCVTGKWETLQASGLYKMSKLGALAAAGVVAVPIGIAAGGLAALHEFHITQKWQRTAEQLNREFQWYAMGKTPKFNLGWNTT